jgi:hypothetical protein
MCRRKTRCMLRGMRGRVERVPAKLPRVLDARMSPFMATPKAGSAWITGGNCDYRIVRGSSWRSSPVKPPLREPNRVTSESRVFSLFFRVGQTLLAP